MTGRPEASQTIDQMVYVETAETRTHKLENTEKYWLEYYRPGRSHNFSFSNQDNLINVGQFLYFQIILTTTGHNHHQLS